MDGYIFLALPNFGDVVVFFEDFGQVISTLFSNILYIEVI